MFNAALLDAALEAIRADPERYDPMFPVIRWRRGTHSMTTHSLPGAIITAAGGRFDWRRYGVSHARGCHKQWTRWIRADSVPGIGTTNAYSAAAQLLGLNPGVGRWLFYAEDRTFDAEQIAERIRRHTLDNQIHSGKAQP